MAPMSRRMERDLRPTVGMMGIDGFDCLAGYTRITQPRPPVNAMGALAQSRLGVCPWAPPFFAVGQRLMFHVSTA